MSRLGPIITFLIIVLCILEDERRSQEVAKIMEKYYDIYSFVEKLIKYNNICGNNKTIILV